MRTRNFKRIFTTTLAAFMVVLVVISVFSPAASAANDNDDYRNSRKHKTAIKLTGREVEEQYELTTKDLYLFSLEGAAPGDTWYGSVKVENRTETDMAISVQSIKSTLEHDTVLFDTLDLRISVAGKTAYRGGYGNAGSPVTDYYILPPGDVLFFDIRVSLPETAGNTSQGSQMDSTWTFKAVFFEPEQTVLDYQVYYINQYFEDLLPCKIGHGYPNEVITEYAPNIDGYMPDADAKQLLLEEDGRNVIYFVYYPEDGASIPETPASPSEPSTPSDSPNPPDETIPFDPEDDIINTGVDMTESNTTYLTYAIVVILALLAAILTTLYIRKMRRDFQACMSGDDELYEDAFEEDD